MGMKNDNEPEVLKGMGINWSNYTPPGGDEWQKFFATDMCGAFGGLLVKLQEAKDTTVARIDDANRMIDRFTVMLNTFNEFGKNQFVPLDSFESCLCHLTAVVIKTKLERMIAERDKAVDMFRTGYYSEQIDLLKLIMEFFKLDLECDKLFYALFMVENKYKMKVLREAKRLCKDIKSLIARIDFANEDLKKLIFETSKAPYETVKRIYEDIDKFFAVANKGVAKYGVAYFDKNEVLEEARQKMAGDAIRKLKVNKEGGVL